MPTDYNALVQDDRIHGSLYVDAEVYREEMDRIFRQGWVFVGHESEVAEPGQWVTRRIGLEPFILTRDLGGNINVVANRCTHRGTALCWQARGEGRSFQCTYHGWTFGLDGALTGVPYPAGFERDKAELGLDRPGQVDSYRGFIFANVSGGTGPLLGHLGRGGTALIDRLCDLSPTGNIRLAPQWIGHKIESNWKMWPESDNDGYHFQFVHASMVKAAGDTYYEDTVLGGETGNQSRAVDHGQGHFELDMRASYKAELAWLGAGRDKVPGYCAALEEAYGVDRAAELLWGGPPHAMVFPNLFLGEMNLARVEPLGPGETVHHHTAVLLDGVEDSFNRRLLRQSEAALGPASFIVPDDAVTAERMQAGFSGAAQASLCDAGADAWIDLSRGRGREQVDGERREGLISDETTNRAFWRHYRKVMAA